MNAALGIEEFFRAEVCAEARFRYSIIRKGHCGIGCANLLKHVENIKKVYNKPCVVAMNRFATDTEAEIYTVLQACVKAGALAVFTDVFLKGGAGGEELAKAVIAACDVKSELHPADGVLERPGISIISPATATMKLAPPL